MQRSDFYYVVSNFSFELAGQVLVNLWTYARLFPVLNTFSMFIKMVLVREGYDGSIDNAKEDKIRKLILNAKYNEEEGRTVVRIEFIKLCQYCRCYGWNVIPKSNDDAVRSLTSRRLDRSWFSSEQHEEEIMSLSTHDKDLVDFRSIEQSFQYGCGNPGYKPQMPREMFPR